MRSKPDIALGDGVRFLSRDGNARRGHVVGVFDEYLIVTRTSFFAEWREIVRFDRIQTIDRTKRDAGLAFVN